MLDDITYLHDKDPQDTLGIAERQWQQLSHEFTVEQAPFAAANIVYAGMGGSSLAAAMSQTWPGYTVPFQIVRDYDTPAYVSDKTYFIAASYSGNTEETLSALEQAATKGARIAVIAGGGKLIEIAQAKGYPYIVLPKAEQPRYAVFYNLKALVTLLDTAGLLSAPTAHADLARAGEFLKEAAQAWAPTIPTDKNPAKQIALEVIGKSAVIYAGPKLAPAAYKWKISFNENGKHVAWTNQFPEFNHNEFMGWTQQPTDKPYAVIDLRSNLEHPRTQKRFEVTERLLSGVRPAPIVVQAQGSDILQEMLWTITFGDFVTIYTALLSGINPAPVDLIEKFKKSLDA